MRTLGRDVELEAASGEGMFDNGGNLSDSLEGGEEVTALGLSLRGKIVHVDDRGLRLGG
jgi:hypothetical protein